METHLFDKVIFGPIHSRRFGISLGVNLLPVKSKICSFNCVYCECGWNTEISDKILPSVDVVYQALKTKLQSMIDDKSLPDVITFSGNGEPTLHPQFDSIIDKVIELRNEYAPDAKIVVLSNATQLHRVSVRNALLKIDKPVLKLDSIDENMFRLINQPNSGISAAEVLEHLALFNGKFSLQTMFLRGKSAHGEIDNTTTQSIDDLIAVAQRLNPMEWLIYPIDRPTPESNLVKIQKDEMDKIGEYIKSKINIPLKISY